jgi:hypothetical protein
MLLTSMLDEFIPVAIIHEQQYLTAVTIEARQAVDP